MTKSKVAILKFNGGITIDTLANDLVDTSWSGTISKEYKAVVVHFGGALDAQEYSITHVIQNGRMLWGTLINPYDQATNSQYTITPTINEDNISLNVNCSAPFFILTIYGIRNTVMSGEDIEEALNKEY